MSTIVHLLNTHTVNSPVEPNRHGIEDWHGFCTLPRRFVQQWVNGGVYYAYYYRHDLSLACHQSPLW